MVDYSLILGVIKAAKACYDQAQAVQTLKPLSDDLVDRAQILSDILPRAQNIPDSQSLENSLKKIQKLLNEDCQQYIQKLSKPGQKAKLRRFIYAHDYIDKHRDLRAQLDSAISDITLALDISGAVSEAEQEAKRRTFEDSAKQALKELQEFAIEALQQNARGKESASEFKETLQEVKAKLDALQQETSKKDPVHVPPTITLTILAKGAKADKVEYETVVGVAMGEMVLPEDASRQTIDAMKELASFALVETTKLKEQQERPNIVVNMLEAEAYAGLVISRVREAQPGKVTITERTAGIAPGSAALAGREASKRTAATAPIFSRPAAAADSSDEEDEQNAAQNRGSYAAKKL